MSHLWRFQLRRDERPVSKLKYNRRNKWKILAKINHQKASCLKFDGGSMQVAFATFNHLMAFWCQWSSVKHDFWCGLRFSSSFENSSQQKWYPFFPEPLLLFFRVPKHISWLSEVGIGKSFCIKSMWLCVVRKDM